MDVNKARARGKPVGVPVVETKKENKNKRSISDLKLVVIALLEDSGEVAPIDFGRFGERAGEIIAGAAYARGKPQSVNPRRPRAAMRMQPRPGKRAQASRQRRKTGGPGY
jgi:hypothetical protein